MSKRIRTYFDQDDLWVHVPYEEYKKEIEELQHLRKENEKLKKRIEDLEEARTSRFKIPEAWLEEETPESLEKTIERLKRAMPTCPDCERFFKPTKKVFCWECPECKRKFGVCEENES